MGDIFRKPLKDGTFIEGVRGGVTHNHEYGFGIGRVKDQRTGEPLGTYNNFNREVDRLLPDFMKKPKL